MQDVTTLFDDLAAIRRAALSLPQTASQATRDDLQAVIERIKDKLRIELRALPKEERFDIIYELDIDYEGGVWDELIALL